MAHHHELVMLDDVLSLETFLADHLPDSYYQYLTVEMNKYHGPQLNQEFQRLLSRQESAEEESATSTWLILDKIFISFFCKNNDKDISSVIDFLEAKLDWSSRMVFAGIPEYMTSTLRQLCAKHGQEADYDPCWVLKLDVVPEIDEKLPPGVSVEILKENEAHLELIVKHWPYSDDQTPIWLAQMMKWGLCSGVFMDGKLVSWICGTRFGFMGLLHTLKSHRSQGHARRCVFALSKRLLTLGIPACVYVEKDNLRSAVVFQKLGFKEISSNTFIRYVPRGFDISQYIRQSRD